MASRAAARHHADMVISRAGEGSEVRGIARCVALVARTGCGNVRHGFCLRHQAISAGIGRVHAIVAVLADAGRTGIVDSMGVEDCSREARREANRWRQRVTLVAGRRGRNVRGRLARGS